MPRLNLDVAFMTVRREYGYTMTSAQEHCPITIVAAADPHALALSEISRPCRRPCLLRSGVGQLARINQGPEELVAAHL